MHIDAPKNKIARHFLGLICDLELVICLPCILPMLEVVHILIKFFQRWHIFTCKFFNMVKSTKVKLYWFYVNPFYKYDDYAFNGSINISEHWNEQLPFIWISHDFDVNLYFFCYTWHSTLVVKIMGSINVKVLMVFMFMWILSIILPCLTMKDACSKVASNLCVKCFDNSLCKNHDSPWHGVPIILVMC